MLIHLWLEATTGTGFRSDIAIDDVKITRVEDYPVVWTDLVNIQPDGSSVFKTSNNALWDAGAASTNIIPAFVEGWVETRITDYKSNFMVGLSYTNDNHTWNTIDFNLYVSDYEDNKILVYERGVLKHTGPGYEVGDFVAVHRQGNSVFFKKNGFTFYTSTCDQSKSMIADISLYSGNLSLYDVRINRSAGSSLSSMEALTSASQFDPVFGDPSLLEMRPVGNDHPTDTVTALASLPSGPPLFSEFSVFPNESNGNFSISYTLNELTALGVTVRDHATGVVHHRSTLQPAGLKNEFSLDLSRIPDNTYLLEFSNGNQKHVARIIKKSL